MRTHHYTGGRNQFVRDLVAQGTHAVEAWGNRREGFYPMLTAGGVGVCIGERYRTLQGLRADAAKAYGVSIKVKQGRNW